MSQENSRFLTAAQLAEILHVTTRTLYGMARESRIPHIRIGRTLRFDLEQVQQALHVPVMKPGVLDEGSEEILSKLIPAETPETQTLAPHDWSGDK